MDAFKLIINGSKRLKNNNISSHQLDSEILMSKALSVTREKLLTNLEKNIDNDIAKKFDDLIYRRSKREPIAQILEKKEFWSKDFLINDKILIPRPETELLVEKLSQVFKNKKLFILDIGTGSGCIILSILSELFYSNGIALDISPHAIKLAQANANMHKLTNKVKFLRRSLDSIHGKKFDLIVSNPPYIITKDIKNLAVDIKTYEPKLALDGGNDGLDVIKKVIYKSKSILKIKGMLALEIGNEQFKKVSIILKRNNFRVKHLVKDYRQNIRCILSVLEK